MIRTAHITLPAVPELKSQLFDQDSVNEVNLRLASALRSTTTALSSSRQLAT